MLMDFLAKSSRSSRVGASVALIIIMVIAIYNWTFAPRTAYLHAAQKYEAAASDVIKQDKIIKGKNGLRKKNFKNLQHEFDEAKNKFFTFDTVKEFFNGIEIIGRQTNCQIYSINLVSNKSKEDTATNEKASHLEETVAISFNATYDDIVNFLAKLMDRPELVSMESMKIEPYSRNLNYLECEITLKIYIIKNKEILQ